MGTAIRVEGLRHAYARVEALAGVSFEVAEGEVFAVLGPNGAGKTTLLEILEGYRDRDAGEATVLGFDPRGAPRALRQQLGIVLQELAVPPYLTVREVATLQAAYYPHPREVDEIIELVGLADKAGERVKRLSGGLQRRLDLALALVGDPRLIFLDEPTTGFDPSARRNAWQLVRDIRALGKTVVLTTHYMDEAQELADRIAVISRGRLVAEGDADTVGGRGQAAVRISFALLPGVTPESLPVRASGVSDGVVFIDTTQPTRDLQLVTSWAVERGLELPRLSVTRPSLEDVYLSLVAP